MNLAQPDINSIASGHQGRTIVINFLPPHPAWPLFSPLPVALFLYKPTRTEPNVSHLFSPSSHLHENHGQCFNERSSLAGNGDGAGHHRPLVLLPDVWAPHKRDGPAALTNHLLAGSNRSGDMVGDFSFWMVLWI